MKGIWRWSERFAPLARRVLPIAALATLFAIGLQFVFAGIGVFGASIAGIDGFDAHLVMGGVIHALLGLLLAAAIVGRQPRGAIAVNVVLFLVATGMMALPRASEADVRAFHPLGALLVFWLTYLVWQRSRAVAVEAAGERAPETAPAVLPS